MKLDDLLTIPNSTKNNISNNKLPLLGILMIKSGKKSGWIFIQNQPLQNAVSYLSNHSKPCLKNIPFWPARRICMKVENGNVRYMKLKELRAILKTQKYSKMVVE